jgi:type VI secretion system VasI family protein
MKRTAQLCIPTILALVSALAGPAAAATDPVNGPGATCREIVDRVARLACFDAAYRTPLPPEPKPLPDVAVTLPGNIGPIRKLTKQFEAMRSAGDGGWVVRARPWREDILLATADFDGRVAAGLSPESTDIFMTMREAGPASGTPSEKPADEQAVLMLSCENDITTLGVLLPKPINSLQANLSLSGDRGSIFKLNWRDTENGDVVIAGRGLESIDTIKTIAGYERVQLQVSYADGARAFVFDTADLGDKLKPLRVACHW